MELFKPGDIVRVKQESVYKVNPNLHYGEVVEVDNSDSVQKIKIKKDLTNDKDWIMWMDADRYEKVGGSTKLLVFTIPNIPSEHTSKALEFITKLKKDGTFSDFKILVVTDDIKVDYNSEVIEISEPEVKPELKSLIEKTLDNTGIKYKFIK